MISNKSNTKGATNRASELTPGCLLEFMLLNLVFFVVFYRRLYVFLSLFCWHLVIALSVIFRITASDHSVVIFKLFSLQFVRYKERFIILFAFLCVHVFSFSNTTQYAYFIFACLHLKSNKYQVFKDIVIYITKGF